MEDKKKEIQSRLVETRKEEKKEDLTDVLKVISPGTLLRTGIEGIQKAKTGGLIVAHNDFIPNLFEGGFKINARFTPQRIIELSKMDGAIILSRDFKKILFANVLLTPNNSILSNETGTRHKAAERTAKQAETITISISQRRDEISLYYKNLKHVIRNTNDIVRRATEILQTLEKHREIFERNTRELNEEELKEKQRVIKALSLVQRGIMVLKISDTLKGYIIELGIEGAIVKSRLKELLHKVEKEIDDVVKDYSRLGFGKSKKILSILSYDELIEIDNIRQCLGLSEATAEILPKGYRLLSRVGVTEKDAGILIKNFRNIVSIMQLKKEDLIPFFEKEKVDEIFEKIQNIREQL